jgi:hypothetical protein
MCLKFQTNGRIIFNDKKELNLILILQGDYSCILGNLATEDRVKKYKKMGQNLEYRLN